MVCSARHVRRLHERRPASVGPRAIQNVGVRLQHVHHHRPIKGFRLGGGGNVRLNFKLKGGPTRRFQEVVPENSLVVDDDVGDVPAAGRAARAGGGNRQHGSDRPRKRGAASAAHRASAWGRVACVSVTCRLAARVRALNIALARGTPCVHVHVVMGPAQRMICSRCM